MRIRESMENLMSYGKALISFVLFRKECLFLGGLER